MVVRNARLWDGERPELRTGAEIVIDGATITRVASGAAATTRADAQTEVIDVGGAVVMPGLIDMHVHLVWSGSSDPLAVVDAEGEQLTTIRAVANAQAQLRAGVTTVRDVGSYWDIAISVARAVDRGHVDGPNIIASGRTIIMTGGHDPFWGIPSDGADAVKSAVRGQIYRGARVIKVAATGGVYGRPEGEEIGQSELDFDELAAAASEAHRFGLKVAAHALGNTGIRNAVRAGIDTIEHGIFLDEETVAEMKRRGTALTPTLLIYRTIADGRGVPPYAVEKARRAVDAHRESFAMARAAGIPIVAGTDAGSCNAPHASLARELRFLHEYGLPIEETLAAATRTAASVLGLGDRLGTIAPGRQADLIVLDGDPLEDLAALDAPRLVMRAGRVVHALGTTPAAR